MTIGDIAAQVSTGLDSKFFTASLRYSFSLWYLFNRNPFFKEQNSSGLLRRKSTVLIKDGKILEDNLKKEKYTSDELLELLRGKDAFSVADVEFAVLEPSGELNVLLKKDRQPLTAKDIGLKVANEKNHKLLLWMAMS